MVRKVWLLAQPLKNRIEFTWEFAHYKFLYYYYYYYKGARPLNSNYSEVPSCLIKIKYIAIRVEKVASRVTALHCPSQSRNRLATCTRWIAADWMRILLVSGEMWVCLLTPASSSVGGGVSLSLLRWKSCGVVFSSLHSDNCYIHDSRF